MRYKSFNIVGEVLDEDVHNGLPSLGYIEVHNVVISNTLPKSTSRMQVVMSESHPLFNFDIWADVIDFVGDPADYDYFHQFMGSDAVNYNIAKYFPEVLQYYKDQI